MTNTMDSGVGDPPVNASKKSKEILTVCLFIFLFCVCLCVYVFIHFGL